MTKPAFYREADILTLIGCSKATLYRWRQAGTFPAPVELGPNTVAWRREDVEAWIASRQPVEAGSDAARNRRQRATDAAAKRLRACQPDFAA